MILVENEKHLRSLLKGKMVFVRPIGSGCSARITHKEARELYIYNQGIDRFVYVQIVAWNIPSQDARTAYLIFRNIIRREGDEDYGL